LTILSPWTDFLQNSSSAGNVSCLKLIHAGRIEFFLRPVASFLAPGIERFIPFPPHISFRPSEPRGVFQLPELEC